MIWTMLLRLAVVGLLLLSPATPVAAQSDSTLMPIPLVTALMAGSQYGSPRVARYVVATTPVGWPAGLVPASAALVGGMTTGSQLIAIFADTTKRFLATYLKSLADSGWKQPIVDNGGGFQSSAGGRSNWYCRDSSRVSAMAVPGATTGAFISVAYQRVDAAACMNQFQMRRRPTSQLELPTLTPPSGTGSMGAHSSGGDDEISAQTRLVPDLSTALVLAHYATQLKVAGWKTEVPVANAGIAAQLLQARDKDGKTWNGWLLVAFTGSSNDVSILMRRDPN
jgi:hypothetical protein